MKITPMQNSWFPKTVELRDPSGKLIQKTVQATEDGPIEILFPMPRLTAEAVAKTKPWVGLTDEECLEASLTAARTLVTPITISGIHIHVARVIEAKLKEKNT